MKQACIKVPLCLTLIITAGCAAAIPIVTQAAPLLVELAGKAFGQKHAKTVETAIEILKAVGGDEEKTSNTTPNSGNTNQGKPDYKVLEVDFDIVKQLGSGNTVMTVNDGDVLTEHDNYKIVFSVNRSCYLYIFQIDSRTKIDIIFPQQGVRQEAVKGETLQIPPDDNWFYLDQNKGIEHVYLVASLNPNYELEELFKSVRSSSWQQQQDVSVNEPVVIKRGIGGTRKGTTASIQSSSGSMFKLDLRKYSSPGEVCLTKWFRHQ